LGPALPRSSLISVPWGRGTRYVNIMAHMTPPPAGLTLRDATESDVPAILRVYLDAYAQPPWNEQNDPTRSADYLRWLMTQPDMSLVMASAQDMKDAQDQDAHDGNPAGPAQLTPVVLGFAAVSPRPYDHFVKDWNRMADRPSDGWPAVPGKLGYVWEIAVHPNAQRRGTGRALMTVAIGRLRSHGVERLLLRSSERADAAIALYRHFGFERLPVRERVDPLAGPWMLTLP